MSETNNTENKQSLIDGYHELEARYRTTRDQLYQLNQQAVVFIEKNPAACIAGAFAVGWVVGKLAQKRWLI